MADGFWFGVIVGWLLNTIALLTVVLLLWLLTRWAAPTTGGTDGLVLNDCCTYAEVPVLWLHSPRRHHVSTDKRGRVFSGRHDKAGGASWFW